MTQWYLFKMSKEQREIDDAVSFAALLVSALFFTTLLIFVLVAAVVERLH